MFQKAEHWWNILRECSTYKSLARNIERECSGNVPENVPAETRSTMRKTAILEHWNILF